MNHLYTDFMTQDVLTATLRDEYTNFQDDLNATSARLGAIAAVRDELAESAVEHQFIDPTLGRLGEIVYSLKNGFIDMPNRSATIIAVILSVFVMFASVAFLGGETAAIQSTREHDAFL